MYEDKTVHYQSDGSGRDKYILQFGGGLWKQERKDITIKSGQFMKFTNQNAPKASYHDKITHYHACGTGRDYGIVVNSGGIINNYSCQESNTIFLKTLRNYQPQQSNQQCYILKNQHELKHQQNQKSRQLSRPKSISVPFQRQLEQATKKYKEQL